MNDTGQGRPLSSCPGFDTPDAKVLEALARHIPPEQVDAALAGTGGRRRRRRNRKLPARAVVWLVIAIGLWGDADQPALWRHVAGTLASLLLAAAGVRPPCKSALSQARDRVGPRPVRRLSRATARPLATAATRGATYRGMPLRAMDGDDYTVPDTPANAAAFGRRHTTRGGRRVPGGYPEVHVNRLIEVGTRLTIEAVVKPCGTSDHASAPALLARCAAGDLALWDCGFHSYALLAQAVRQGTFALAPVPSHAVLAATEVLPDGSRLAEVYPSSAHRRRDEAGVVVRVIEYTFDDPGRPGHGERHRLTTTLLDAERFPADELVVPYHERWEIEIANDEITTHQLARRSTGAGGAELRSRTPRGVVQEVYGVLPAHNAVRALMHEAALRVEVDPRRLGFMHAVRVVRDVVPIMRGATAELLPRLYDAMIRQIGQGVLPPRDGRIHPRVIKVKMSKWPKKRPHHYDAPQPTKPFQQSIAMLN